MAFNNEERFKEIEKALRRAEGAHYALHDMIARALVRMPRGDYEQLMHSLAEHAELLDPSLGVDRIAGYRDELGSIAEEVEHARPQDSGWLDRIRKI